MKAREAEIVALENTIKENEREASFRALSSGADAKLANGDEINLNGLFPHINGDFNPRESLSPETMKNFAQIRKSLELAPGRGMSVDLSLSRLDELMRCVGWFWLARVGVLIADTGRWPRKSRSTESWSMS